MADNGRIVLTFPLLGHNRRLGDPLTLGYRIRS